VSSQTMSADEARDGIVRVQSAYPLAETVSA
jgi:hypothetical protein